MISANKNTRRHTYAITSARMSQNSIGGCFGGECKLPPLNRFLFDEIFRLDELRRRSANLTSSLPLAAASVGNNQTGEIN